MLTQYGVLSIYTIQDAKGIRKTLDESSAVVLETKVLVSRCLEDKNTSLGLGLEIKVLVLILVLTKKS